jgi:hypothetical protein
VRMELCMERLWILDDYGEGDIFRIAWLLGVILDEKANTESC